MILLIFATALLGLMAIAALAATLCNPNHLDPDEL
jgi:hypothetical protein